MQLEQLQQQLPLSEDHNADIFAQLSLVDSEAANISQVSFVLHQNLSSKSQHKYADVAQSTPGCRISNWQCTW